jgi:type III restriction enzyme
MPAVTIDNPILNSPYREPTRHFRFDANDQITTTIDPGRRGSSYFLPIAAPKKKAAPGLFDAIEETTAESGHVNRIRQLVKTWRDQGWPDVTPVTRTLLEHWLAEDRDRPLFFCQVEALESSSSSPRSPGRPSTDRTGSRSTSGSRPTAPGPTCSASRARWRPAAARP